MVGHQHGKVKMSSASVVDGAAASTTGLTRNQKRGFLAAWGGWALDGMDASIYALVLVPALTDLLPNSGIAVNQGSVGYYGSILQAMFLLGWGLSMVWGPISDRVGRVRALMLTILCYSLFTFLCGVVNNIWQLAVLRILVGHRHRRRAAGRGGVSGGGVVRESAQDRRRTDAHRLLLRVLLRLGRQLLHRRQLRVAMDVHLRRLAGVADRLHPVRRA